MAKQIRALTFARIMGLLKSWEEKETPHKLTLELRSDQSGVIRDDYNTVHVEWTDVNDLNERIKEMNYER